MIHSMLLPCYVPAIRVTKIILLHITCNLHVILLQHDVFTGTILFRIPTSYNRLQENCVGNFYTIYLVLTAHKSELGRLRLSWYIWIFNLNKSQIYSILFLPKNDTWIVRNALKTAKCRTRVVFTRVVYKACLRIGTRRDSSPSKGPHAVRNSSVQRRDGEE